MPTKGKIWFGKRIDEKIWYTKCVCEYFLKIKTETALPREVIVIVALEEAKYKLLGMRANIKELGSALRIDELKATAEELDQKTLDPDFWSNQENSSKILQKIKQKL